MFKRLFSRMILLAAVATVAIIGTPTLQTSAQEQPVSEIVYSVQSNSMSHPGMGGW